MTVTTMNTKNIKDRKMKKKKYMEIMHGRHTICLSVLIVISLILACLGWITHAALAAPESPTSTKSPHQHVSLPPHMKTRRAEFFNNTFIQMLHQHQLVVNTTNCWVCGLLPHAAGTGMPLIPAPFSRASSAYGWYTVFFDAFYSGNTSPRSLGKISIKQAFTHIMATEWPNMTKASPEQDEYENNHGSFYPSSLTSSKGQRWLPPLRDLPVYPQSGRYCIKSSGTVWVGESDCAYTLQLNGSTHPAMVASLNTYFVCGNKAYTWLPNSWAGTCYIAWLLPPTYTADAAHHIQKRGVVDAEDTAGQEFGDFARGFLPFWGPMFNNHDIRHLTRVVEATINVTAGALSNITAELQADRLVTLQNRLVLDIILADRGGVCKLIGASCCVYIFQIMLQQLMRTSRSCTSYPRKYTRIMGHGLSLPGSGAWCLHGAGRSSYFSALLLV